MLLDKTCSISCYASGCYGLTVNCTRNEDNCIVTCNETYGIPCPIVITPTSDNFYGAANVIDKSELAFYYENISEYIDSVLCNKSTDNMDTVELYDDGVDHYLDNENVYQFWNKTLCYRATYTASNRIVQGNKNIVCSAGWSCYWMTIQGTDMSNPNNNLYCTGQSSCWVTNIYNFHTIYCLGQASCAGT